MADELDHQGSTWYQHPEEDSPIYITNTAIIVGDSTTPGGAFVVFGYTWEPGNLGGEPLPPSVCLAAVRLEAPDPQVDTINFAAYMADAGVVELAWFDHKLQRYVQANKE